VNIYRLHSVRVYIVYDHDHKRVQLQARGRSVSNWFAVLGVMLHDRQKLGNAKIDRRE